MEHIEILWSAWTNLPTGWPIKKHSHHFFHLFYQIDGSSSFIVDEKEYIMQGSDILIVPPEKNHEVKPDSHTMCSWYEVKYDITNPNLAYQCIQKGTILQKQQLGFDRLLNHIVFNYQSLDEDEKLLSKQFLYLLIKSTIVSPRHSIQSLYIRDDLYNETVRNIIYYIEQNFDSKFKLDGLALDLKKSKNYLCYLFKKETGFTIVDYLNYVKIRQTLHHLYYTDILSVPINTISSFTGFQNVSHFNRVFKSLTGISPKMFQQYCDIDDLKSLKTTPLRTFYDENLGFHRKSMRQAFKNLHKLVEFTT